jgi:crotonobetainyl-CoA:carnitine CoA-transferase CaiB-like acyl-CoA transferase
MAAADARGALSGIRVLELGTTIAGPFCGRLLADFGAEVIKVEPLEGDPIRTAGKQYQGKSLYAASILRNKSLVAIDLRTAAGQGLVRKMVAQCDVVIENFRPGSLEKWGLGYDELVRVRPGLVMVRISGYGQTGPYSRRPGYGVVCEAVGGLRYVNGEPGRAPVRVNIGLTDYITGLYAAYGAMVALRHRDATGEGQYIDTALYECAFSLMEQHVAAYDKLGVVPQPMGPGLADSAVNNLFRTRDGVYVHVQGSQTNSFRRLCLAMGRADLLDDERFNTRLERARHGERIDAIVGEWVQARDYPELARIFDAGDVTYTRIYTMADIFADPHYAARGMLARVPDEEIGDVVVPAPVPRLSGTPGVIRQSGGRVGADTARVLTEMCGLSEDDIARLERENVVQCHAPARGGEVP